MGYRIDRFKITKTKTPNGFRQSFRHRAVSIGGFGGIGSAVVAPWTTNYQTTDEYAGFIVTRGLAAMVGINQLTVGIGVGWDHLSGRDKNIWIYENRPWYGLTVGLNLN